MWELCAGTLGAGLEQKGTIEYRSEVLGAVLCRVDGVDSVD